MGLPISKEIVSILYQVSFYCKNKHPFSCHSNFILFLATKKANIKIETKEYLFEIFL